MTTTNDPLALVNENEPNVEALLDEYTLAWSQDSDAVDRIPGAEAVRYTRWPGQHADGLKHQELLPEGQRAMPYDRAPDCRVNLADSVILSQVDVAYAAFWNARVKTAPAAASSLSVSQSAEWRQMVSWMIHGPLRKQLIDDVEFAAQTYNTIGWVVLHPCWRATTQLRMQRLSLQAIVAMASQADQQSLMGQLPNFIVDPTLEEAGAELLMMFFPSLKVSRARRVIRELREEGEAEFPAPEPVRNLPELAVLVPWQDFIMPVEATGNPQAARVMFRRMFLSEAQVRARAQEEEWNEEFVEAVIKNTAGMAMEQGTTVQSDTDENNRNFEIVYAFSRGVDDDGVPGIFCTVISPHLGGIWNAERYGKHWLADYAHGEMPFLFLTTEVTGRRPSDARGVPDVVATSQMEMKQQRDATYVFSQLSVTPPLQKKGTQASKLPPELGPLGIINNVGGGEWSWFAPEMGKPEIAFKLIEDVRKEVQEYFGIPRPDSVPSLWQARQQRQVMRWLATWGEAFWQLSVLAYQHLSPDEVAEILGRKSLLTADQVARHRLLFWFDVRAMDPAWVESLLKSISELVLPADSAGIVDRSKLIQVALEYLDPTLAQEVTTDQAGAKQATFKAVREEVNTIMNGSEALYVENDPTAKAKLAFTMQIIQSNPEFMMQLDPRSAQFNPRKAELMEKWQKNLGQSATQEDNKTIGRLGVRPGA